MFAPPVLVLSATPARDGSAIEDDGGAPLSLIVPQVLSQAQSAFSTRDPPFREESLVPSFSYTPVDWLIPHRLATTIRTSEAWLSGPRTSD